MAWQTVATPTVLLRDGSKQVYTSEIRAIITGNDRIASWLRRRVLEPIVLHNELYSVREHLMTTGDAS